MKVKICGVKSERVALDAAQAGADFIGFVFAPSSRQIDVSQAEAISQNLANDVKKVGVFVNAPAQTINSIVQRVGLDVVQLHGDEDANLAKQIQAKVIKACPIQKLTRDIIENFPCDYLLVDSPPKEYRGGSGETFNWDLLNRFDFNDKKLILAGGLQADNVQTAIRHVKPYAVDVSSGVETAGEKDLKKIKKFIKEAKKKG